jgi:hypothetical protein
MRAPDHRVRIHLEKAAYSLAYSLWPTTSRSVSTPSIHNPVFEMAILLTGLNTFLTSLQTRMLSLVTTVATHQLPQPSDSTKRLCAFEPLQLRILFNHRLQRTSPRDTRHNEQDKFRNEEFT